jgi:hypothetical protein
MRCSSTKLVLNATLLCFGLIGLARAAAIFDQTNLVALPAVAQPSEFAFTAATAQALTVTLTDLQEPAAFQSLQIAVTLGDALVGSASISPTTHTATVSLPAAAGDYVLRVIGTPNAAQGIGSFGVCVAPATSAASCIAADSFSGSIFTPSTPTTTGSTSMEANFTSTVAGTYTVTITDDLFPVALQSVAGGIVTGTTPVNTTSFALGANQVTLAQGTPYTLILGALPNATALAGLYGVHIADPTGASVFDRTSPVGNLPPAIIVDNPTAQALSLSLTDFAYPAPLASVGVAVTEGSTDLGQLTAAGTLSSFAAPAGSVFIWEYAMAGAQPGVYGVNLGVSGGTSSLYSATQVAGVGTATTAQSFAFVVTLPSAGTYNLAVTDFQFPGAFASISQTVAQNGVVLPFANNASSGNFTAAKGVAIVLVNAVAPTSGSGLGIFDVTVQSTGPSPTVLLDQTQAVGGVINSQTITLGNSGNFTTTLADLGFPAAFSDLAAVVSLDGTILGKIYGAGTFSFAGAPGNYVLTSIATPGSKNYGLYSLNISPAAPTVTFAASASSVATNSTVTLTWSSQNATACMASGGTGWAGSQSTSGSLAVVVGATETLTLTCTNGSGGSASQSVTVTATAAAQTSSGGGSLSISLLAGLAVLVLARRRAHPGSC